MNPDEIMTTKSKPAAKTSEPARIMDIAKPGGQGAATAATSRPVLVSNRVLIQDPMVKPDTADTSAETLPASPDKPVKVVVKPISPPEQSESDKLGPLTIAIKADTDADGVVDKPREASAEPAAPSPSAAEPAPTSEPGPPSRKPEETAAAKLQADQLAADEIDELIESKAYNLPIETAENRRARLVTIVGVLLILILAAAWLNVALDAGFITIPGVEPLTHFFK